MAARSLLRTAPQAAAPPRKRAIGRPRSSAGVVGRDGLIAAVCELLQTTPLRDMTNGRIADQARVDTTLIRYHFRNRAELMVAVADRITGEYEKTVAKTLALSDGGVRSELAIRVGLLIDLNAKYPFLRSMLNEEVRGSDLASGRAFMTRLTAQSKADFGGVIKRGKQQEIFAGCDTTFMVMAALALAEAVVSIKDPRLDPKLFAAGASGRSSPDGTIRRYRGFVCDLLYFGLAGGANGGGDTPEPAPRKARASPRAKA